MTLPMDRQGLKRYALDFVANEEKVIPINGNYFKYESGTGEIKIVTDQGVNVYRGIGGAVKIAEFKNIRITDLSGANDSKVFSVGYGEIDDNAVSGEIDVDNITTLQTIVNEVDIKTTKNALAGNCFSNYKNLVGVAGQYSHIGLRNPTASGKNLIIDTVKSMSAGTTHATGIMNFTYYNAADVLTPQTPVSINKKFGEAVGVGVFVYGTHTAIYGTIFDSMFNILNGGDYTFQPDDFNKIIVTPGSTFFVIHPLVSYLIDVSIGWTEKDV